MSSALRRHRQQFLEEVNAAYARLRQDASAWKAIESERRAWDATLTDGLIIAEGGTGHATRRFRKPRRRRT
jgi:hypothetical protein